jgi:hypothetical protein
MRGQAGHYWSNDNLRMTIEESLIGNKQRKHFSVRPFALRDFQFPSPIDSSLILKGYLTDFWEPAAKGQLNVKVTPLLEAGFGFSSREDLVFTTAPGLALNATLGAKLSLYADFFGGAEKLPGYISDFTDTTQVLPTLGLNRADQGNPAFAFPTARLSYAPSEYFQFELGYGRNFFGQGYRSMFLSDVAFNYPYLKITTDVWNIKYVNLYSALDGTNPAEGSATDFQRKYSTTHYLSWAISPRFNLGLFETIVWQAQDSLSDRGFDPNYLNPIIFYRPVEFSIGSPDNALIGLDLSFEATKKIVLHGQVLFDEFLLSEFRNSSGWWGNKWGAQIGFKSFDSFGFENLRIQGEFNLARPFTYTHGSVLQNFGHYNQPLSHQLGANFYEGILTGYYEKNNFFSEALFMFAEYGRDPDSLNLGGDIFTSYVNPANEFGNTIAQGIKTRLYFQTLSAGVILNRDINLRASLSYTYRRSDTQGESPNNEHIFGLRIATEIYNRNRTF